MKNLVNQLRIRLGQPTDIASIAVARVCFGLIMLWEVIRYFDNDWIRRYWMEPAFHFTYFGFSWVSPWPGDGMYWHFLGLGGLALMVAFGLFYRVASVLFFLGFSYVFLLEQARYLNHFYLVCLISGLMAVIPAHRAASLDARWGVCKKSNYLPVWCLWLLRFQMGLVYFFGGIAKINSDWLAGEPLRTWLGNRSDFPLIGPLFEMESIVMFMNYGGLFFDLLIVPFLLWKRTRIAAFVGVLFFNFTNAIVFSIGIFPWFAIAMSTLFFDPSWPRRVFVFQPVEAGERKQFLSRFPQCSGLVVGLLAVYCSWQLFLPLRHWLYPGHVSWTEEGHNYAWHMKLRSKSSRIRMMVTNEDTGKSHRVDLSDYLESWQASKMAGRPDMLLQFVDELGGLLRAEGMTNIAIRVDTQVSLNGRDRAPLIDPNVDLLKVERSIWPKPWLLPVPDEKVGK